VPNFRIGGVAMSVWTATAIGTEPLPQPPISSASTTEAQ
jgi:hypothetical protein